MTGGPLIAQFSLHQRDAEIETRERFVSDLHGIDGPDLLALATCHRVEIAFVLPPAGDPRELIALRLGVDLPSEGVVRIGRDALLHLMRVACGLDSVVRGQTALAFIY